MKYEDKLKAVMDYVSFVEVCRANDIAEEHRYGQRMASYSVQLYHGEGADIGGADKQLWCPVRIPESRKFNVKLALSALITDCRTADLTFPEVRELYDDLPYDVVLQIFEDCQAVRSQCKDFFDTLYPTFISLDAQRLAIEAGT